MSTTTEAIRIIDRITEEKGMSRETATELIGFVEEQRGDLVTKQDIKDMATTQDLAIVRQEMATKEGIKDMATKQDLKDMATKEDIKDMATTQDLAIVRQEMATKEDIKDMATKQDLKDMATKEDIKDMATTQDLAIVRQEMATKEGIKDMATKQDLKDMVTKQDFAIIGQEIAILKQGRQWLKWVMGIGFTVIPVVLLTVIIYLHSDAKAEMKELKRDIREVKELLQRG